MAHWNEGPITMIAGEALIADRLVKISAGTAVYCDAGEEPVGITVDNVASGALVAVVPINAGGVRKVTGSKDIATSTVIYPAADGCVSDAAGGGRRIGVTFAAITAAGGKAPAMLNVFSGDLLIKRSGAIEYFEDFITGAFEDGSLVSETADKADWLQTLVDGDSDGGDVTAIVDDGPGGILVITTNDKTSDSQELQLNGESFKLAVGKTLYFETRIAIDDVDKADWFVGLAITDTTVMTAVSDRVGFECLHDGNVDALVEQDSTQSLSDTTSDIADGTLATFATKSIKLAFFWDGVDSVFFYVDGVLKITKTDNGTTIVIPDDEAVTPTICVKTTAAQVVNAWIDYVAVVAER